MKPIILGLRLPRVLAVAAAISAFVAFGLSSYRAPFSFQVNIGSSISGNAQVYYDIGRGIREEDSSIVSVHQGAGRYRLPLPSGTYRGLRFDPTDKSGNEIALGAPRIIDRTGRTVRKFQNQFAAIQDIDRLECGADLCRLKTGRGTDSILSLNLEAPFALVENPELPLWNRYNSPGDAKGGLVECNTDRQITATPVTSAIWTFETRLRAMA